MKLFQKIELAGEDVQTLTRSGRFYANNADGELVPADVHDGAVVKVGKPIDHDVWDGMKDLNVRELTTPTATNDLVAFVDYVGISKAKVMGVTYYVGDKVAGTYPIAGENTRIRIPMILDEFWLCDENFDAEPVVGNTYVVKPNDTVLTAGAKVAGELCVQIEDTKPLIEGMVNTGVMYRCTVVAAPALV